MDLGAYAKIEDLSEIAKSNSIEVPRLRGYRLMKDETAISKESISEMLKNAEHYVCEQLCCSVPFWNPNSSSSEYSWRTDLNCDYYMTKSGEIRWDRIHGKKRKILKFEIKKQQRRILNQFETFNKYVGREDVLYIHSRIGGGNWYYYGGPELTNQPWFIEKVDDCFDNTYCDIYARIK